MSPINPSDVKGHLRPPFLTKIHLVPPQSQPDATGFSAIEPDTLNAECIGVCRRFRPRAFIFPYDAPAGQCAGLFFDRLRRPSGAGKLHERSTGAIQKRSIVKIHSVFLRSDCTLPDRLDPCLQPISEKWSVVEEIPALVFDTMIRQAGWRFMWAAGCLFSKGHWVN